MNVTRKSLIILVHMFTFGWMKPIELFMGGKQTWTYELKSIDTYSSNTEMVKFDVQVVRISRGVYAASGSFTVSFDIVEGDSNQIEVNVYRSENGVRGYRLMPFKVARQHLFQYFSTFYKELAMDTLRNCSNLPVFKNKFEPPFEKKTYTLSQCEFNQEGFPQHLQSGFYKVNMTGYGDVEWYIAFVAEVQWLL